MGEPEDARFGWALIGQHRDPNLGTSLKILTLQLQLFPLEEPMSPQSTQPTNTLQEIYREANSNGTKPTMAAHMEPEARLGVGGDAQTYNYSPLSQHGNIRLVRLLPHKDKEAPIRCQLFEYSLQEPGQQSAHLYEALVICVGFQDDKRPIYIQTSDDKGDNSAAGSARCLHVTSNLYVVHYIF